MIKKIFFFSLIAVVLLMNACTRVSPKEVLLRVNELGDDAGEIDIFNIPGRYSIAGVGATDYFFPTTEQNYRWTQDEQEDYGSEKDEAIQLQIEGNDCKIDVGIRFYINNQDTIGLQHLVTKYPLTYLELWTDYFMIW